MKVLEEACKKAIDKEENAKMFFICLQHGICPKCASEKLGHAKFATGDDYECPDCDFKWSNLEEED